MQASEILALIWYAADLGVELPDFVRDQLGLWLEYATDDEIEDAAAVARELAPGGASQALGALRRWRKTYCPGYDGAEDRDAVSRYGRHRRRGRRSKSPGT